jgi:2-dehydropantoate 2-reductase
MLEIHSTPNLQRGVPMARKKPTIGIIGLGPVGSILAAHLIHSGENVVVEDAMPNILLKIKKDGLNVSGIAELAVKADKVANSLDELAQFKPEIVFIVTKACYLKPLLVELKQVYTRNMKIVSFQNGLGNEQFIAENLVIDTVYRVVINYAGNLLSPGNTVMNWFQPPNYVGVLQRGECKTDETTKQIADILTAAGLRTEESRNIMRHVWEKNILNSALCSICAVTGQTMAEAMQYTHSRNIAIQLLEEGLKVAEADGYDFGSDALTKFTAYLEKGGAHKPSMLIDVENKKPTEVDFMSGAIARYGQKYNVPTPVNSIFTDLLKTIESRYLKS